MRLLRSVHAGMQAFVGAVSDEGLLGLCDTILEALHFCPGFQTCLTSGALRQPSTTSLGRLCTPIFSPGTPFAVHIMMEARQDTC